MDGVTALRPRRGMSARLAVLCGGVLVASLACDVQAPERSAQPAGTATLVRRFFFRVDGSIELEGSVILTLASDHLDRGFDLGAARILEPEGAAAWAFDDVESDGPWPLFIAAGGHAVERFVMVRAHVPAEATVNQTSVVPSAPPSTLELSVFGAGPDEGLSQAVLPILTEDIKLQETCPSPDLTGLATPIGAALDWSAATLPGLVSEASALAADPLGQAYFVGTYPSSFGGAFEGRVYAAKGGLILSITEVPSGLVAIAPGDGEGPTLAMHDTPTELEPTEDDAVVVSRRDASLAELWSHRITSTPGLLVPAIATSGGRVLVGASVTIPLTVDGVEIPGAEPSAYQLLVFDEGTGELIATKGGIDAASAVGLAGGGFGIADADGFVRVLESDLSERWSAGTSGSVGAIAAGLGGDLWATDGNGTRRYDAAGNALDQFPSAFASTLAPLPDGSVLLGTPQGLARATSGGELTEVSLPYARVGWCSARPGFLVAPAPGGAVIAARPETPQDGASPGRGVVARLELLP